SSRRGNTIFSRDWSSDVCSSDLCRFASGVWILCLFERLGFPALTAGQYEVQYQRDDSAERNAGQAEFAITDHHAADAEHQRHREIGRATCREREEISGVAASPC